MSQDKDGEPVSKAPHLENTNQLIAFLTNSQHEQKKEREAEFETLKINENSKWDEMCTSEIKTETLKLCVSGLSDNKQSPKELVKEFCTKNLELSTDKF